jgi:hypothetical protein
MLIKEEQLIHCPVTKVNGLTPFIHPCLNPPPDPLLNASGQLVNFALVDVLEFLELSQV